MKTLNDLKALYPTLCDLLANNDHEVGECTSDDCNYAFNSVFYEEDGWSIEIDYQCCGRWSNDPGDYWTPSSSTLVRAWGEVTEIIASHYDEESGEEIVFTNDDLEELYNELDKVLEKLGK